MIFIFEKLRTAYLQIPKSGCTTIKWNLAVASGILGEDAPGWKVNVDRNDLLLRYWGFPIEYADFFLFTFVRNPFERLVSGWYDKIVVNKVESTIEEQHPGVFRADMLFPEFVRALATLPDNQTNGHFQSQTSLTRHLAKDVNRLQFIGKLENFAADWGELSKRVGIQAKTSWWNLRSPERQPYQRYYDPETLAIAKDRFALDCETFGYSFEPIAVSNV